jgi:hypothetical protein
MYRQLHGVMFADDALLHLKKRSLLFDAFRVFGFNEFFDPDFIESSLKADLNFLLEKGVVVNQPFPKWLPYAPELESLFRHMGHAQGFMEGASLVFPPSVVWAEFKKRYSPDPSFDQFADDYLTRLLSSSLEDDCSAQFVPICRRSLPRDLVMKSDSMDSGAKKYANVLHVALRALPVPDDNAPWEDILLFRSESMNKEWNFRRWLKNVATKPLNATEILEEIEWMVNEYATAMRFHRIKATQSFVDVFVVSPLEVLENLIKLNLGSIAKGLLAVGKHKVELLDAEMRLPGRECAYVFDAREKFGDPRQMNSQ